MASALQTPSVLVEVCQSLIPPPDDMSRLSLGLVAVDIGKYKEGYKTLARLARVCKAFTNSALAVLWRDLHSVEVLLKVLPCLERDADAQYTITNDIPSAQWDRFKYYAGYVRALHQRASLQGLNVQRIVWTILKQRCCGRPLLPNLRTLEMHNVDVHDPVCLNLLLSPSLRTVVLSFGRGSTRYGPLQPLIPAGSTSPLFEVIIQLIASALPCLTYLRVLDLPGSLPSSCMEYLTPLHQLHRLDLGNDTAVGYPVLQCFARFPSLRVLNVAVVLQEEDRKQQLDLDQGFSVLEVLQLNGQVDDLRAVIQACSFPALRSISLAICAVDSVDVLTGFLAGIYGRMPLSMSVVDLTASMCHGLTPISLATMVEPVLSWGDVTTFKVKTANYVPILDNDTLRRIADAWPNLADFELCTTKTDTHYEIKRPKTHVTMTGLVDLAKRCSRLRSLVIPALDIATLPAIRDVPQLNRRDLSHLYIKDLMGAHSANLMSVAVILDLLWPCVSDRRSVEAPYVERRNSYYYLNHIDNVLFDFLLVLTGTIAARREYGQDLTV
ncbi:hypothetical protein GY45DRAFT_1432545 [Cubamyces sp. BRFM 1775]|nr:hypothetical protein GY45DRAFT_1432545 [Cubamyces sp. BRFM 1775]